MTFQENKVTPLIAYDHDDYEGEVTDRRGCRDIIKILIIKFCIDL